MELIHSIEKQLEGVFKNAPKIPENGRKWFVSAFPWLALIFGVLQLWAAYTLWDAGRRTNDLVQGLNEFGRALGVDTGVNDLGFWYWLSLAFLVVSAVLLLAAYPGLKAQKKQGWDLLFVGVLVSFVFGILMIFVDNYYGGGFGRFIGTLIGTAIGLWILYQVRDYYLGKKHATNHDKVA